MVKPSWPALAGEVVLKTVAATLLAMLTLFITNAHAIEDCGQCRRLANQWAENASPLDPSALEGALQTSEATEFLKRCGHAPIRLFEGKLLVEAEEDGELSPHLSIHVRGDLNEPVRAVQHYSHDFHPALVDIFLEGGLSGQAFPDLTQYGRLRTTGPEGNFFYKKGEVFPIFLEGHTDPYEDYLVKPNQAVDGKIVDERKSDVRQVKVWRHNVDLNLHTLVRLIPPGLRLKFEKLTCPLPKNFQDDFCAKMQFPFDPSAIDKRDATKFGNQVNPRDKDPNADYQIEPKILKKVTRRHDALGFAYAVQYENARGERFPKKYETRYTDNPYFILDLLTNAPCPGWKIRRVSVNFHHKPGGGAYAYRMDRQNNELIPTKMIFGSAMEQSKKKIFGAYAKDAKISFIGCNTMTGTQINKIKDPINGHTMVDVDEGVGIGDFFSRMNDRDNPIAVVSGYDGTCYPIFPTATTPRIGKKKTWKNGKKNRSLQAPGSAASTTTHPSTTDPDSAND